MKRDALFRVARPFRRPKAHRAKYAVTGGGDVADSPSHVDFRAFGRSRRRRNQLTRIQAQADTRSTILAEGIRGAQGVRDA